MTQGWYGHYVIGKAPRFADAQGRVLARVLNNRLGLLRV